MHLRGKKYILAAVAGLFVGASLLYPVLWPLVLIGTAGLFIVVTQVSTRNQALSISFVFGVSKTLIALIWFWAAYPLDWLGIQSVLLQGVLVIVYWLPAAIMFGLGSLLLGLVVWYTRAVRWRYRSFLLASAWVLAEILGAAIFSLYTLGPGSSIQTSFSFGFSGYALIRQGWLGLIALWGNVYGLSFLVALLSLACIALYQTSPRMAQGWVLLLMLASLVPVSLPHQPIPEGVYVVKTSWTTEQKKRWNSIDRAEIISDILMRAAEAKAAYIIFPEDARITEALGGIELTHAALTRLFPEGIIVVDSGRVDIFDQAYLRAHIYDTKAGEVYSFDKQYLVPQGEYVPYVYGALIAQLPQSTSLQNALRDISYRPGINQADVNLPAHIPAVLFCFESVTPQGVAEATRTRGTVPFVAHVVSHGWFHREVPVLVNQLDAMLLTQARYTGQPIAQSGNLVTTKLYLPNGEIVIPEIVAEGDTWTLSEL